MKTLIHNVIEKLVFPFVGLQKIFLLHSRLAYGQWSLVPEKNFTAPSWQIPSFSVALDL